MPEIGEVARVVHFIRANLVGKTLAKVSAVHDENIFGKVGTSGAEIEKALTGKKIKAAHQQGKYFWLEMASPPHLLMHFGMAGWFHIKDNYTGKFSRKKKADEKEWPPKYTKILFETKLEKGEKTEAAFVDYRRFARVRLIDVPGTEMRKTSPLVENGPDPVIDKNIVTLEWFGEKCRARKVPIKALILDQSHLSGIGNWVGDEILYDAKIHPEQYCNTLSDEQIKTLHTSLHYVCGLAVETLSDSDKFPETWLFKHRWGKGRDDANKRLPNGEKIVYFTVGGRTSAVVPSVQKKTGPVAGDVKDEDLRSENEESDGEEKPKANMKRKRAPLEHLDGLDQEEEPVKKTKRGRAKKDVEEEKEPKSRGRKAKKEVAEVVEEKPARKRAARSAKTESKASTSTTSKRGTKPKKEPVVKDENDTGRRRSKRLSSAAD